MCIACITGPMLAAPGAVTADVFPSSAPAPGWLRAEPIGARITWTGCAGIVLEFAGTRICFDPFVSNPGVLDAFLRPARPDTERVLRTFAGVHAAFIGHTHWDHAMDVATIALADDSVTVYGSATTAEICRRQGVQDRQVRTVEDGSVVSVGPFEIEAVASQHGLVPFAHRIDVLELGPKGLPRSPFRWPRGQVFSYRVRFADVTFYLHTSAGFADESFARQQPVDVVVACLAARQGTPDYIARLGEQLKPKVFVPCHHDNFLKPVDAEPVPVPRLEWNTFLADVGALGAAHGTRLVQLPRGLAVDF